MLMWSVTRLGRLVVMRWLTLLVPDNNKALEHALEQPQRARTIHKVKGFTLGRKKMEEVREMRLDSDETKKTKMPNTDVRHPL